MDDFHVVTFATEEKYYFPYLVESCKRHGKQLEVLGMGTKWKGFAIKFINMIDYLKTLPDNHIVCFIDGYDVICVRDLNEFKQNFINISNKTNCKIVIAVNKENKKTHNSFFFSKLTSITSEFAFGKCNNYHLNSGTYIGYKKDLLEILENIRTNYLSNDSDDDQVLLTNYCKNNDKYFYKDNKNLFFSVFFEPLTNIDNLLTIENGTVYVNNEKPFFLHAIFGTYLDNVIIKLGYKYDYANKIQDQIYNSMMFDKFYKSIGFKYFIFIIIFILFITLMCAVFKNKYNLWNIIKIEKRKK